MKKALSLLVLVALLSAAAASCGGGGGGGTGGDEQTPEGATTVSGTVSLSKLTSGAPLFKRAISAAAEPSAGPLIDATVELYDADRPERLHPVAITLTDSRGAYKLSKMTHAADNGSGYKDGDPIPAGNYTIIAAKINTSTGGYYIGVQPYVKKFDGDVMDNALTAQDSSIAPAILTMFGLPHNSDGTFGSDTTPLAQNAAVQVTFNTAMARMSVLNAVSIKDPEGVSVQGEWKMSPDLLSATFYPEASLTQGNAYMVAIKGGNETNAARNLYGNKISNSVTGRFVAAAMDDTPPNAQLITPELQTEVPITTPIQIASNEVLDINTFVVTASPGIGDKPSVRYVGKIGDGPKPYVYEIMPSGLLQLDTNYEITVDGAKDMARKEMTRLTFNFKTEASPKPPSVLRVSPEENAQNVSVKEVVSAFFSANMDASTLDSPAAEFTLSANGSPVDGKVSTSGTTATFVPAEDLSYSTTYTASIGTGAKDIAGKALTHVKTWSFTTVASPISAAQPDTTITQKPSDPAYTSTATFAFTSTIAGSTFQCSLDSGAYAACTSPKSYTGLSAGSHAFEVKAVSEGGEDPTPASYTWTIAAMPIDGLIARYSFSGNANDSAGSNNGTMVGSPSFTTDRNGNANGAIALNGSSQYIELPNESSFDLTTYTLYAIVKVPDYANKAIILNKPRGTTGYGNYCLDILQSTAGGNAGKAGYVHDVSTGNWSSIITTSAVPVNSFVHVAATFSGTTFTGFHNGAQTYKWSSVPAPLQTDSNVIIGAHLGFGAYFKGAIDEVLIYNRALSADEISALYNALR